VTGTTGATKNYLTRSQAVRKLQIPLADFRRLCIFKGIYPREPRSKKRVNPSSTPSTTFYYAKDIAYLMHEPLLAKLRDQKALSKKISKALGKGEVGDAKRWERDLMPRVKLDHVVKERYPTFVDALRDLDDALSLLFLFAHLPSTVEVPPSVVARCKRLTLEFEHYIIRSHSLRKSFLSIKGIYYQATIQGQDILWLVPYKFVQRTTGDVDFRIMATFVEFYCALLGFVNFRLYTGVGLVYPPRFDAEDEERGAELGAFKLEGKDGLTNGVAGGALEDGSGLSAEDTERAQAEADRLLGLPSDEAQMTNGEEAEGDNNTLTNDTSTAALTSDQTTTSLDLFQPIPTTNTDTANPTDTLLQPSLIPSNQTATTLFEPFTFFLSRETPRHPIEFLLKAFGCKRVGWSSSLGEKGSYCDEDDDRITHQVVDRPELPLPTPPHSNEGEIGNDDGSEDEVSAPQAQTVRVAGRIYIQPQWVWDCINAGALQRPDLYAPGATLPPHLSPWMKPKGLEYDPTAPLPVAEEAEEVDHGVENAGGEGEEVPGVRGDIEAREMEDVLQAEEEDGGMDVNLAGSEDDSANEEAQDAEATGEGDWDGLSDAEAEEDPDDTTSAARQMQAELEAEALGRRVPAVTKTAKVSKASAKKAREEREAREDVERRKMMMPNRKRKMYEKMVYSNARKAEEAEKLVGKRRRVEGARKGL